MRRRIWLLIIISLIVLGIALIIALFLFRERYDISNLQQITPPDGTQLLIFPIDNGVITAGYRNPTYFEKNHFEHYGTDITAANGGYAEILASGDGVVLGIEYCDNSLGNIAVIRYDNVFIPEAGTTISLIARYYHMTSVLVNKEDIVHVGQTIGTIDGRHKWYHHVHLEFDMDLRYPFYTPQVAEATSELLQRSNATGEFIIEPMSVLVVSKNQRIFAHPNSDCCTEKDEPRFAEPR